MGEISGFGGGYEQCCQDMLEAGVTWVVNHPQADLRVMTLANVYGVHRSDTEETQELEEVVAAAAKGEATGAMVQAVMMSLMIIHQEGWSRYCAKRRQVVRDRKEQEAEEAAY